MTDLTREQITEWLRLAEAATPGPWEVTFCESGGYDCMTDAFDVGNEENAGFILLDLGDYGQLSCKECPPEGLAAARRDADLIAASRTAVPALCRALLDAMDNEDADMVKVGRIVGAAAVERDRWKAEAMAARPMLTPQGWPEPGPKMPERKLYAAARAANEKAEGE